ncbi:fungal trichothecene efflux pump [Lophium mytilinum]|uniref:Fungal trichothecene efflux pump n=1 Tax=Lophium mytilinum TaxID=390894 RepID=A0A6A6Q9X7_9PEZI|nr:fungal trichothecene efflux pump [Lophium mytilinum]
MGISTTISLIPRAIGGDLASMPKGYYWSPGFIGTFAATCLAQVSGYLGWTLPANTISLVNEALGPSPNFVWLAVSWTAGFSVGFTLVGRLSDIFGRRWFYIACSMLALIANVIGAAAQSVEMLIATNTLNGLASAGQLSFFIVIAELVPNSRRGPFNAIILATSTPFAVFGPPIARAFFTNTSLQWRWSYILGVIVNTLAVVLYFFFYHPPTYEMLHVGGKNKIRQLASLDWLGITLFVSGLTVFLIGLNWGGSSYPWKSAHTLGALLSGFATLVLFCIWEAFCGLEYPLIPMSLFKSLKYDVLTICASVGCMVYYSMTVIWPTMASALYAPNNIQETGWLSCAVGGGLLLGQILGGFCHRYVPKIRIQMIVVSAFMAAFVAALASSTQHTRARTVAFMVLGATAAGYVESVTLSSYAYFFAADDIGLVSGAAGAIRIACGAVATSMYSSILSSKLSTYLPQYVTPAATGAGLPAASLPALFEGIAAGSYAAVPGITGGIEGVVGEAVKHAYSESFRIVFLCTLPFGAISLVAAFFCPNVDEFLVGDVARKLHKGGVKTGVEGKLEDGEDVV